MGQDKRRQEESPMEQRRNQIVELVNLPLTDSPLLLMFGDFDD